MEASFFFIYFFSFMRILDLSSLEKRRLRGNLIVFYNFLTGRCRVGSAGLFSLVTDDRMHRNGRKLCWGRFRLNMRVFFFFFTASVIKHWKRLPSVVVDVPCLSMFKRDLDKPLINMFPTALFHSIWFYSVLFLCVFFLCNSTFHKKKKIAYYPLPC